MTPYRNKIYITNKAHNALATSTLGELRTDTSESLMGGWLIHVEKETQDELDELIDNHSDLTNYSDAVLMLVNFERKEQAENYEIL